MPGCPSWNGRWSGEATLYAIIKNFSSRKAKAKAQEILSKGHYSYGWSDGWRASIQVREVSAGEVRSIRKKSKGFCGYDWMVESILKHGKILADHEVKDEAPAPVAAQPPLSAKQAQAEAEAQDIPF